MGGAVAAIEAGFYQDQIADAAFAIQRGIESGDRVVVGVNRFVDAEERPVELQGDLGRGRAHAGRAARASCARRATPTRSGDGWRPSSVRPAGTENLFPPMKEALRARATLGEVSDVLRGVYGEYRPTF